MPLGYFVPSYGRTGAFLRMARGHHELVATGPCARLGALAPHVCTTTISSPDGRPLEVRVPFLFATWLILGCLVPNDEVAPLLIYQYIMGAERMGAALDAVLQAFDSDITTPLSPSVLRRHMLRLAVGLRADNASPFTVTLSCLLVVGGNAERTTLRWRRPFQLALLHPLVSSFPDVVLVRHLHHAHVA